MLSFKSISLVFIYALYAILHNTMSLLNHPSSSQNTDWDKCINKKIKKIQIEFLRDANNQCDCHEQSVVVKRSDALTSLPLFLRIATSLYFNFIDRNSGVKGNSYLVTQPCDSPL